MPKLNSYILLGMACAMSAYTNANTDIHSLSDQTQEKIIVYSKSGKLYKFEMYLANSKTPALVNTLDTSDMPQNVEIHSYLSFNDFMKDRANIDNTYRKFEQKQILADSQTNNNIALAYGYIPSVQALYKGTGPDACYKSDPIVNRAVHIQGDLQVTSDDKQHSSSLSTENGVKAGLGKFKAQAKATYSTNYTSSTATGDYNLEAALSTIINTGIPAENNLTQDGIKFLQDPSTFLTKCGTAGVDAYIAGIVTTLHMSVATKSHSTATSFGSEVSAGYGPVSISSAFKNSKSKSADFTSISFTFETLGNMRFNSPVDGASDYLSYMALAENKNAAILTKCQATKPDLDSCAQYMTNMAAAVKSAMGYAGSAVSNPPVGSSRGYGAEMLYAFDAGINIANKSGTTYKTPDLGGDPYNPNITYTPANYNGVSVTDPFAADNIIEGLRNAVKIMYQLNTLAARAELMANLSELRTVKENLFLEKLDKLYMTDSEEIRAKSVACYNKIMSTALPNPAECNIDLSLAGGEIKLSLRNMPENVYQLYHNFSLQLDSTSDLLFRNSIALQYDISYVETATGLHNKDNKCVMIRAGNQINFGLAYYNGKEFSDEFFGGVANRPDIIGGYIFPSIDLANLGKTANTYYNNDQTGPLKATGVKWWQPHKDEKPIELINNYKAAPLYFVYNSPYLIPIEGDNLNLTQAEIFNKIIGSDIATGDSSAKQKNQKVKMYLDGATNLPSMSDLAKGNLFMKSYTLKGQVTTLNDRTANQCLAGVYLPPLKYPGKNRTAQLQSDTVYGSINAESYLCNKNPDWPNVWTNFRVGSGTTSYGVKSLDEEAIFTFKPIKNFFGLKSLSEEKS